MLRSLSPTTLSSGFSSLHLKNNDLHRQVSPGSSAVKNPPANAGGAGLIPDSQIPWRRAWQSTPVFLPGESHQQKSLAGDSHWSHTELDMTYRLNNNPHMPQTPLWTTIQLPEYRRVGSKGGKNPGHLPKKRHVCTTFILPSHPICNYFSFWRRYLLPSFMATDLLSVCLSFVLTKFMPCYAAAPCYTFR